MLMWIEGPNVAVGWAKPGAVSMFKRYFFTVHRYPTGSTGPDRVK
jgi:hypothetical protein